MLECVGGRRTARQAHRHCVSASHTSFICLYLAVCVFELFGLNKYYTPLFVSNSLIFVYITVLFHLFV